MEDWSIVFSHEWSLTGNTALIQDQSNVGVTGRIIYMGVNDTIVERGELLTTDKLCLTLEFNSMIPCGFIHKGNEVE